MVESGGADVAGRLEASGCGCGEVGRDEVEGPVAIIGEVVVRMGKEVVVTGSETGSESRGGDGAIGSTGCAPSPPVTPWSAALLEVLEAVVEAVDFLAVSRRAFLVARSASLEVRCGAGCRLRAVAAETAGAMTVPTWAGMSASTSSRLIGSLKEERRGESV